MKKRNLYIALTIVCIGSVIVLNSLSTPAPAASENLNLTASTKIPDNLFLENPILVFTILLYTFMFFAGLVNLGIFCIRKINRKPIVSFHYPKKKFPLNQENSAKLLFLISFLILAAYLIPSLFLFFKKINPVYIVLGSNLLLQLGAVFIVLKHINHSFFGFKLEKNELNFVFTTYMAIIPIIIASVFINLFLLEFFGLRPGPSPIIRLIPLIKTKLSLFLFVLQTVLIAPFVEELIFRGVFYKLLRKKYPFLISAAGLSLFFALLHRSLAGMLGLFIISFSLCYIYEKTQKISTAFIFHALHNTITLLFFLGTKV
jgi:membrane protease YdiL (CAAX protease family)